MRTIRTLGFVLVAAALGGGGYGCSDSGKAATTPDDEADTGTPAGDGGTGGDVDINRNEDDAEAGTDAGPTTCATTSAKAEVSPVDMYVMLDRSSSMTTENRWEAVVNAVGNVVYDPRFHGMGLALQYFPQQTLCRVSTYATPDVPMQTLPAHSGAVVSSLGDNQPFGNSPMVPALEGALSYANTWQVAHPARTTVVVLATDGLPDDSCQTVPDGGVVNNVAGLVQVAQQAANTSPPIRTFVLGLGDALTDLNQIAAAGGTQNAILVDTSLGVEAQFMEALNAIRRRALACDYVIPPPTTGEIDFGRVNVQFKPNDNNANEDFVYVANVANCSLAPNGGGWYYDDEKSATKVMLCPQACERAKASQTGQLDILFGCFTKAAPTVKPPVPK